MNKIERFNFRKRMVNYAIYYDNNSKASREFSCDVKTVRKWRKRYIKYGNAGLMDKSRKSHHSPNKIDSELEEHIVDCRKKTPAFGAVRLNDYFNISCHINTIYNVLKRNNLIIPHKTKRKKKMDMRRVKALYKPFENIMIDVKYLNDISKYYTQMISLNLPKYQYTARDVKTGGLYLGYADSVSVTYASIFVKYILKHLKRHNIDLSEATIQTDNGTEFSGNLMNHDHGFVHTINELGANHRFIPPHRPNLNSDVETVHHHEEREFFDLESYSSYREFYDKIITYQYFWNYGRYNYYKGKKMPIDIMSEHFDGKKLVQLLDLPPMLINSRKKYLQLKNNLIKFDSTKEHVLGLAVLSHYCILYKLKAI